ncbi:asparagine synthase [Sulfuricella sp. T08]|uniref:XrtA/PEP-CTERM system amidotransferase n=1 Tax=Sulfuricella sp. T08 TaxID=1632857 RepID=UPI000617A138|nr:XrtA/PEP-CTERM system amidotransferase [Sulfuricella sp. T08]GAO34859.1 asparagine synthase [Sulfuricella sp. T08]
MCGIAGIFDIQRKCEIDQESLARMNQTQFHRGPDEGGLHTEPGVGLGHRRLSIIDLSSGHQPLFNEDGSVVVVFNGEIYNFVDLIPELQVLGHIFRTRCDTEVIVHAWEQWGEACVDRFRGMFAFALWDRNRETLFLARDRMGVKPLYYGFAQDGMLIFGSELKALTAYPACGREIDPCAIEEYFAYGYVAEPRTIYKNSYKLPPGHTLVIKRGKPMQQPREYWDVPFQPITAISEQEAQEELLRLLRESIKIRLVSEVPLGAFLSGGVDSSAVVAMMAGLSNDPVNTCSISFGDPAFNESEYAAQVATRYKTNHHVAQVDPDDFDLIDKLAAIYDEPYADSSAIPTYRVCELARKTVIVALSGDGGDENFAGYRRYRWHMNEERMRGLLPTPLRRPLFGMLGHFYPKADWAPKIFRAKATLEGMARDTVEGYFHIIALMNNEMRERLFSDKFKCALQGYRAVEVFHRHDTKSGRRDPLSRVQYLDIKTYLVGDILTKVDRASMAHGLEVREPLLDHKLVEWASGLPSTYKQNAGEGKFIFKKAMEPYLPNDILYRKKMGFAVPLASWFRGGPLKEKVRSAVLGPVLAQTGYFNVDYLHELVDQHQSGLRDYSTALWTLLMFESFLRNQQVS